MASITSDWSAMGRHADGMKRGAAAFKPLCRQAMMQSTALVQGNLKFFIRNPGAPFGPLIAGKANNLLSDPQTSVSADGMTGRVSFTKGYSSVMDEGRRPGAKRPPREAIERWIIDKRIITPSGGRPKKQKPDDLFGQSRWQSEKPKRDPKAEAIEKKARQKNPEKAAARKAARKQKQADAFAKRVRGLAFVIARSISRKGIKGRQYVLKALHKSRPHLEKIWNGVAHGVIKAVVSA